MEQELLQFIGIFIGGLISGVLLMLLINKLGSGSASASGVKQEYDDYQEKVETHFEETSKKFQEMTAQYQDLYKHLSVGATSLCRPDSVAATLADQSVEAVKLEKKEPALEEPVAESAEAEGVIEEPVAESVVKEAVAKDDVEGDLNENEASEVQVEADAPDVKNEQKTA